MKLMLHTRQTVGGGIQLHMVVCAIKPKKKKKKTVVVVEAKLLTFANTLTHSVLYKVPDLLLFSRVNEANVGCLQEIDGAERTVNSAHQSEQTVFNGVFQLKREVQFNRAGLFTLLHYKHCWIVRF